MPGNTWVEQENLDLIETNINQLQISINNLSYDVGRKRVRQGDYAYRTYHRCCQPADPG